jgi:hypothetical protein
MHVRRLPRSIGSLALVGLAALVLGALSATPLTAQQPSACAQACRETERTASAACRGRRSCVDDARFAARRCELACQPLDPVARCRAACAIESDVCDAGCRDLPTAGEQRGCLRRCGSQYHITCPQQCDAPARD